MVSPGTTMVSEPPPASETAAPAGPEPAEPPAPEEPPREPDGAAEPPVLPGKGPKRPAHYGLAIKFESRPDDPELGRLVESTVWVNDAHPAYLRAAASRSEGYHLALAVAMALAPLAVEPAQEHGFVSAFLARWGEEARRR
jgi:hypothetical protein